MMVVTKLWQLPKHSCAEALVTVPKETRVAAQAITKRFMVISFPIKIFSTDKSLA